MTERRGFSIIMIFWVIMIVLFAGFFAQSFEILQIGRRQSSLLKKNARIIPVPPGTEIPLAGFSSLAEAE
jgi:hypothetical protein